MNTRTNPEQEVCPDCGEVHGTLGDLLERMLNPETMMDTIAEAVGRMADMTIKVTCAANGDIERINEILPKAQIPVNDAIGRALDDATSLDNAFQLVVVYTRDEVQKLLGYGK